MCTGLSAEVSEKRRGSEVHESTESDAYNEDAGRLIETGKADKEEQHHEH